METCIVYSVYIYNKLIVISYFVFIHGFIIFQPSDAESFEESDDDGSEYSEASEDSDSEGILF